MFLTAAVRQYLKLLAVQKNFAKKVEITPGNFRAIMFYDFKCGLNQQQRIYRLHSHFGNEALFKSTVYVWFVELKRGSVSLNAEFGEGCPRTAVVPGNVDAVREVMRPTGI